MSPAEIFLTGAVPLIAVYVAARYALPPSRRRRSVSAKVALRAIIPSRLVRSRSGRTDFVFFIFNALAFTALFGWSIVSAGLIATWSKGGLDGLFGARAAVDVAPLTVGLTSTLAIFLAFEFAYWLNHWMSHRFAIFWAFHKVHHTAESLSILTSYRVHPVDTIIFYNMNSVAVGATSALLAYFFGRGVDVWMLGGTNMLLYFSTWSLSHLQHSHLWISFSGGMGRLFLSPAHHQIHHSVDQRHHNRNFGSTLAIFDWLFGTLHVPTKKRERLTLGVEGTNFDPHSLHGSWVMPFVEAANVVPRSERGVVPAVEEAA